MGREDILPKKSDWRLLFAAGLAFAATAGGFFAAGWFTGPEEDQNGIDCLNEITPDAQMKLSAFELLIRDRWKEQNVDEDLSKVDANEIARHLEEFARVPHLAGQDRYEMAFVGIFKYWHFRDEELADYIKREWESYNMDSVLKQGYNVLLSYPNPQQPNLVRIGKQI